MNIEPLNLCIYFDGTELDVGVVVEFMLAKFPDIPAVILRSDFRTWGEKEVGSEDWNFMCLFYPRTRVVQFNALQFYQEAKETSQTLNEATKIYYSRIARLVLESLDSVRTEKPLLKGNQKRLGIITIVEFAKIMYYASI